MFFLSVTLRNRRARRRRIFAVDVSGSVMNMSIQIGPESHSNSQANLESNECPNSRREQEKNLTNATLQLQC